MVENNSAIAFTCPLYRRGTLGIGNDTYKRPNTFIDDTFGEHSKRYNVNKRQG